MECCDEFCRLDIGDFALQGKRRSAVRHWNSGTVQQSGDAGNAKRSSGHGFTALTSVFLGFKKKEKPDSLLACSPVEMVDLNHPRPYFK